MNKLLLVVALAFLATGCSTRVGDFTMVSNSDDSTFSDAF